MPFCQTSVSDLFPVSLYPVAVTSPFFMRLRQISSLAPYIYTQWLSPTVYYHRLQYNICTSNILLLYIYIHLWIILLHLCIRDTPLLIVMIFWYISHNCIHYVNTYKPDGFLLINYEQIPQVMWPPIFSTSMSEASPPQGPEMWYLSLYQKKVLIYHAIVTNSL